MARGHRTLQVSFAGGEMSPEMWSRFDDPRARSGAARLLNNTTNPRGAASRRPGFALVQKTKDSTRSARLLDFRYSNEQTLTLEMSRAVVESRDIGYIRFHTEGATLLQPRPNDYVDPETATDINTGGTGEEWSIGTHGFQTGNPIVFTMDATTEVVTFDTSANEVVTTTDPHNFQIDEVVIFRNSGGALPAEVESGIVYYIEDVPATDRFTIATKRGGQPITFATAGTGTHKVGCMPNPMSEVIDLNKTYYAIRRGSPSTAIAIAATKADALANNAFVYANKGTVTNNDIIIHYDYRAGDTVIETIAGVDRPFYCRKAPWGTPGLPVVYANDHTDHPPGNTIYWVLQPGASFTGVTFTPATDLVNWTGHPLSDGDPITFTTAGTLPAEITAGDVYYVRNPQTNSFQLSASLPGPIIDLTTAGTGTHTAFGGGIYEVPHDYAEDALFEIDTAQSGDVLTLTHQDRYVSELRRMGATQWTLVGVAFSTAVGAPGGVEVGQVSNPPGATESYAGKGTNITAVTTATPYASLTTGAAGSTSTFAPNEVIRLDAGVSDIPAGQYIVVTSSTTNITLNEYETGDAVAASTTTITGTPFARTSGYIDDLTNTYVVTALLENDEESPASTEASVENNLLVEGAYNTINWEPVGNAIRYRVYKEQDGLFGFIGETEAPTTTFRDDNIAPDLSITPPIVDSALNRSAFVTFSTTLDTVNWTAHGLEAGAPVLFDTNNTLPTGITYGTTYYVLNPMEDSFQLAATPESETAVVLSSSPSGVHVAISGHWPATVTYFEQRRIFGGARLRPQDFWMTASGTERDLTYHIPTLATDRIHDRLAAGQRSQIRHAIAVGHLLLLTSSSEYRLTPLNNDALTPGSVSARAPTHIGASSVAPALINNVVLFPADRGGHVREMGFLDQVGDYVTGDVSLRAAHLFDSREIIQMAYQQAPYSTVWAVSSAGTLLAFSYMPEEQIAGWSEMELSDGGTIESVAVVSEGMEDRVYIVAKRGSTRYVERMGSSYVGAIEDVFYVDSGITYDGAAVSSVYVPHLAGTEVVYLADGIVGSGTVSLGGVLTLSTAASKIHVGIPYTSDLLTLPLGLSLDAAFGTGRTKNINEVFVRVNKSGAFEVGPASSLSDSPAPDAGSLLSELVPVVTDAEWTYEGQLLIRQSAPLPLIVTGLTLEVASGG